MTIIADFRIGETASIELDAVAGDPSTVVAPEAYLAPADMRGGTATIREGAARTALTITPRAASGTVPAGWTVTLTATASATLSPGVYGIDVKLPVGGTIEITETTAFVQLTRSAAA
ncbi:MAG: hypothetical protein KGM49_00550 [Sphingomonadales bacterium]|nr:hypothetical protein [Sphingomonadales bacterium]